MCVGGGGGASCSQVNSAVQPENDRVKQPGEGEGRGGEQGVKRVNDTRNGSIEIENKQLRS